MSDKYQIQYHHGHDWCHICGLRTEDNADVWFAENAEHDVQWSKDHYMRICAGCANRIATAALERMAKEIVAGNWDKV